MSMFITKEKPEVDTDGLIKENVQIAKGVLTIARKEGALIRNGIISAWAQILPMKQTTQV